MATSRLVLPIPGGTNTDGTADNVPATPIKVLSAAAATANTPKVYLAGLAFDQTTDEHWLWQFPLPGDYVSGGTLKLTWGSAVASGNVIWKAAVMLAEPASTDMDTSGVFLGPDLSSATAVPGTIGQFKEDSITLTMTGADVSGGADLVVLFIGRDAGNASDTAAGDAYLWGACFEYTS